MVTLVVHVPEILPFLSFSFVVVRLCVCTFGGTVVHLPHFFFFFFQGTDTLSRKKNVAR